MNTTARGSLTTLMKRDSKCSCSRLLSFLSTHRRIEFRFLGSQAGSDIDKSLGC